MSSAKQVRLFVVPVNDGEALELMRLLLSTQEMVVAWEGRWGASWEHLNDSIQTQLLNYCSAHPKGEIIGIELAGPNPYGARNIDHHRYQDEDRSHPLSSLEQVAQLLGVTLTRRQQLVAANDRGYVPAMLALGATEEEIADVRGQDRRAQGVTEADEEAARRDLEGAEWRGRKVLVRCGGRITSAHTDFLYGRADEVLLQGPNEWQYTGPKSRVLATEGFPEKHWSGGSPESGYFGVENPSEATREKILKAFRED